MPFGKAIWDELLECIFENFEIPLVKHGKFKSVRKSRKIAKDLSIQKVARTKQNTINS